MKMRNFLKWLWLATTIMNVVSAVFCVIRQATYPWWMMMTTDIVMAMMSFLLYLIEADR